MMNTLQNNFENTVRRQFGTSLEALESAFRIFGIDYYLIGAFVRDVWTDHISALPEKRVTRDLDFAIYINEHEQYETLKKYLVKNGNFMENSEPYRLFTSDGSIIDLIPFGGIENNEEVYLKGNKPVHLSVFGTKEVTANACVIEGNFKVITLPGLAVLKLVVWHDNTGSRRKDITDFNYLLMNYADMAFDELYLDKNLDILGESDELRFSGAKLLGREMAAITSSSGKLHQTVNDILEGQLENFSNEDIDEMYRADNHDEHILKLKMVKELLTEYKKYIT